jgi:hypothetical protein
MAVDTKGVCDDDAWMLPMVLGWRSAMWLIVKRGALRMQICIR